MGLSVFLILLATITVHMQGYRNLYNWRQREYGIPPPVYIFI